MSKNNTVAGVPLQQIKPTFIKLLLASVAVAGIIGIISLLSGEFGEIQGKILLTVILTSGFSIGMLIYSTVMQSRYQLLGLAGGIIAAVSFVLGLWLVWSSWRFASDTEYLVKGYLFSAILAFAFAHICLLIRLIDHAVGAVRVGTLLTIVCIIFLAGLFGHQIYLDNFGGTESIIRIMGVLGILVVLGTVIIPIWARLQKK